MSKKLTSILAMSLVLLISTVSFAAENKGSISLSGVGNVIVKPDVADLNFSITTSGNDSKEALNANNVQMKALIDALKKNGFKDEEIKTNYVVLNPRYDYEYLDTPEIVGYDAVNSITVTLNNLDKIGNTLSFAVENGANSIGYIQYRSSKGTELYNQALINAIKEAKLKADALKGEVGAANISIIKVEELSSNYYRSNTLNLDRKVEAAGSIEDVPINVEDLNISASVRVEFAY